MPAESWQFAIETLPERPVQRAGLLLAGGHVVGPLVRPVALVLDLATDEFVRVPGLPREHRAQTFCLAPDGSQIVASSPAHGPDGALCLHTLATGQQRWFHNRQGEQNHAAALTRNGHQIATLSTGDDPDADADADADADDDTAGLSLINVIDTATGHTRRAWHTSGGWSQQSTIAWSPDGTLLAATYLDPDDDLVSVVIEAATGTEITRYDRAEILSSANTAWRDDHELIYLDNSGRIVAADLNTRTERHLGQVISPPLAVMDDHFIYGDLEAPSGTASLLATRLDGESWPFISIRSPMLIEICDIATQPSHS